MRKLLVLILTLAVLAGALSIVDVIVRKHVAGTIAARIEARSPGSHAVVTISSFPFLGRLAASGTVPSIRADVTNVTAGDLRLAAVDLHLEDLKVSRSGLAHGQVHPVSIASGLVVAVISQAELRTFSHVPVTLGAGTVGVLGVGVPVHLKVIRGAVVVTAFGLPTFRVPVSVSDILPCVGTATVVPGNLRLTCRFTSLPGLLTGSPLRF